MSSQKDRPFISIVVPARNEEENIERLLESIEDNDYEDYEVVVVDGGSTDNTREVAKSYNCRVIDGPQKGTAVARNVGWRNAEGEVIYFLDADWFLGENTLEEVAKAFQDQNADTVGVDHQHHTDNWVNKAVSAENKFGHKSNRSELVERAYNKLRGVLNGYMP